MKVAVILDSFPKVSESFILNQIVSLIDKGIDVRIFAARGPARNEPIHELYTRYKLADRTVYEPGQPSHPLLRKLGHILLFLRVLVTAPRVFFQLVRFQGIWFNRPYLYSVFPFLHPKVHYDVIHAHFGPIGVKVCHLQDLGFLKAPLVCSFHGFDVDRNDFRSKPGYYRTLFDRARLITGNSQFTVSNIQALGCPADKLAVIPESLITTYFTPGPERTASEKVRILTVARLVEFKGVEYAIRSIADLVNRGITGVAYTIVGDGPLKQELVALAGELGVTSYIRFAGAQSQNAIIEEMKASDIFLLTGVTASDGRQENQGLVLQEAQAMELPVVASRTGGIPEGVEDNVTGYLVAEKQVELFAERLARLIDDPSLRKRMGKEGRRFVSARFDSHNVADDVINLYVKASTSV